MPVPYQLLLQRGREPIAYYILKMPARTVHMVITESDKVHLGFHTYP